ncbi:MAG: hypothetical protein R3Y35_04130 [Clostridia bacterium]
MDNGFNEFTNSLNIYKKEFNGVPNYIKDNVTDVKFSVGHTPVIYYDNKQYELKNCQKMSMKDMQDLVFVMCDYSMYKHSEEIKQGFISYKEKYRVGICGTAVNHGEKITNIKHITSLTVRIPRFIKNASKKLIEAVPNLKQGLLIVGEPSSGKTTILKDLIYRLKNERLTVIDERWELSIGDANINVLNGYRKDIGINQSIRNLGTKIIICDELDENDIKSVKLCVSSGVSIIATVHGNDIDENIRPLVKQLISTGAFKYVVKLAGREKLCEIQRVWKVGELYQTDKPNYYSNFV